MPLSKARTLENTGRIVYFFFGCSCVFSKKLSARPYSKKLYRFHNEIILELIIMLSSSCILANGSFLASSSTMPLLKSGAFFKEPQVVQKKIA